VDDRIEDGGLCVEIFEEEGMGKWGSMGKLESSVGCKLFVDLYAGLVLHAPEVVDSCFDLGSDGG